MAKNKWYAGGLNFQCMQCGQCCAGPGEGYIWITRPEIELVADFLKEPVRQVRQKYLNRIGLRLSIIEQPITKNCIFLRKIDGGKKCMIYPVRPNQCRTWPFWSDNLACPDSWNRTAQKCSGVNRGRHHSFEQIEKIRKQKKWWKDAYTSGLKRVTEIYNRLDLQIRSNPNLAGRCSICGKCCNFEKFDHRLFVTPPELMYLAANLDGEKVKPMTTGRCPYNVTGKCTVYKYRFAGCRIFCCTGNADFQSGLSESALEKFKSVCGQLQIPYRYTDLPTALNDSSAG